MDDPADLERRFDAAMRNIYDEAARLGAGERLVFQPRNATPAEHEAAVSQLRHNSEGLIQ